MWLLWVGASLGWAQQKQSPSDPNGVGYDLINQANEWVAKEPLKALEYVEKALERSYKTRDRRLEGFSHNTLGAINYALSRYELSVEQYELAFGIFREIGETQGLYNSCKYLGMSYDGSGNNEKALAVYEQFLGMARQAGNTEDVADTQNRIARIHFNQQDYQRSFGYFQDVLKVYEKQAEIPGIINTYNNLGQACASLGQEDEALRYYQQAESLAVKTGNESLLPVSLNNISQYYSENKSYDKALQTRQRSLSSNRKTGSKKGEMDELVEIGNLYLEQNQAASAIPYFKKTINLEDELGPLAAQTDPAPGAAVSSSQADLSKNKATLPDEVSDRAEKPSSLLSSRESNRNSLPPASLVQPSPRIENTKTESPESNAKFRALKGLTQAYEAQGQLAEALESEKKANQLERELLRQRIAELEMQLESTVTLSQEVEKSTSRIQSRQAELDRQRMINYTLLAILLVLGVSGILVLRSYRARQKANQKLALKSLRSQMNPHFIFNSLNSVNSFIARNDARAANKYLSDFSRLMRAVMENSENEFVPLSSETQMLKLYLGLEHFRFQDRFDYTFTVDESIDKEEASVPPMLIQPYIENAIWHGLRYKKEKGQLDVSIEQAGAHLIVRIADDGIGRTRSQELKTVNQKRQRSTGLKNTAARLQLINELYDKTLRVEITDLQPTHEDVGTCVKIYLPISSTDGI